MKNFMLNFHPKSLAILVMGLFLSLGANFSAQAQELSPDHLALARKYVDLTDQAQVYERALIQTGINSMRTIISQNPEISEQTSDAVGVVIKFYAGEKDELFDEFARIYALKFSIEELNAINAFYESEVGQKLSSENRTINGELTAVMRVFQHNLNTEFFAKVRAELRDKGVQL